MWTHVVFPTNTSNLPAYYGPAGALFRAINEEAGGPPLSTIRNPEKVASLYFGTYAIHRVLDGFRRMNEIILFGAVRRVWPEADAHVPSNLTWLDSLNANPQRWVIARGTSRPDYSKQHWIVGVESKTTSDPWSLKHNRSAGIFVHLRDKHEGVEEELVKALARMDECWTVAIAWLREAIKDGIRDNVIDPFLAEEITRCTYPIQFEEGFLEKHLEGVHRRKARGHHEVVRMHAKLAAIMEALVGTSKLDYEYPPQSMVVAMVDCWGVLAQHAK